MMSRTESVETGRVLGYLGENDVLYCSRACAAQVGQARAAAIDHDEYQVLVDRGRAASAIVCPVCGSDYPLDWTDEHR